MVMAWNVLPPARRSVSAVTHEPPLPPSPARVRYAPLGNGPAARVLQRRGSPLADKLTAGSERTEAKAAEPAV